VGWRGDISADRNVCQGQACIEGIGVPVSVVLDNLAAGLAEDGIIRRSPALTGYAIRAASPDAVGLDRERIADLPGRDAAPGVLTFGQGGERARTGRRDFGSIGSRSIPNRRPSPL